MSFLVEDEKYVRFFIVQNKKAREFERVDNKFKADLYQYELLHDRPVFRNTRGVRVSAACRIKGIN